MPVAYTLGSIPNVVNSSTGDNAISRS